MEKSGLVPSGLIDFGFRPSIGLYFFSDDLLVDDLGFRAHGAFGGIDWYRATGTIRYTIAEETPRSSEQTVQFKGVFSHRPDWLFYGLGPESLDDEGRYVSRPDGRPIRVYTQLDTRLILEDLFAKLSRFG